jgi:amino acid adenylation domain-containing protein
MRDSTIEPGYRLSPVQKVFEGSRFEPSQGLNVEQVVCRTTEALNLSAFRESWQRILDHHPALRVSFGRDEADAPFQEVHSPLEIPLCVEDQFKLDPTEREGFLEAWLEKDRQKSFKLSEPPLMRVTIIRWAGDLVTWVWTFHHILLDGRSFLLLLDDFFACYEAASLGKSIRLPERTPFSEFISWHQSWLAANEEPARNFWRQLFTDDPTNSALSISRSSSPIDHHQAKIKLEAAPGLTEGLLRVAKEFDLTVNTIVQGTWALLLSRYYCSKSVTFATIRACRQGSIDGAADMVGLLMNFLPVHAQISETVSVVDFFHSIRAQQLAIRPYQWTPWDIVRDSIPVAASKQLSDSCVLFERYNLAQEMTDRYGKKGTRTFSLLERANIPLLLSVCERPQVQFELNYQTAVFAAKDVLRLGRSFMAMLEQIQAMPTISIRALQPRSFGEADPNQEPGLRFPLSDIQQAYVISRARRADGGGAHSYHEFERVGLDVSRLEAAWRRLIDRHDMLRARATDDGAGEILDEVPSFEIPVTDLTSVANAAQRERALTAIREEMSHRAYDPCQWPLFDLRVSQLPANRFRLHFSFDLLMLDAAGVQRVLGELQGLYENPGQWEDYEPSFRDYALARQALGEGSRFTEDQAYWEKRLPELATRPALPVATDPKGVEFSRFTRRSGTLSAEVWERLQRRAEVIGLTPTAFLATAFGDILGKWCNQRRFTLNLARWQGMEGEQKPPLGNFVTATLLEVDLDGPDFSSRAWDLMERLRNDVQHDLFSGIQVLRAMRKKQLLPDEYGMPVVLTSLVSPEARAAQGAFSTSWLGDCIYEVRQSPNVWLDHLVLERDGALVFHWDAVEGLFPRGLLEEMMAAYTDYLQALAGGAATAWAIRGPKLSASQQEQRLRYNATKEPYVPGLLHAGFFATAQKNPALIAVDDPERKLTYGELAAYAHSVARRLSDAGVGAGDLVAVVMEKGWEQIASVMGILRAGAAYLPIDPEMPKTRLEYLLSNGRVPVAITQAHLLPGIAWPSTIQAWTLDRQDERAEPFDGPEPSPDSLAYIIYTSGSTGVPKGVMIAHQAALNTIVDINRRLKVKARDRVLSVSALSFDLSVYDIFGMLEAGGAIVLPAPERARDPIHWVERMNEGGVTIWNSAPALMQMLLTILDASRGKLPANLRWTMLSGDWIPIDLPGRLGKYAPRNRLLSLGGATEVSIWSIAYPVEKVDPGWTSIPYGMPLANQTIHVLDEQFEPCPDWTAGEIFIGGIGLAMGYLADEAKTKERFVQSPVTGEALYRTGDFGRFRPEGFVEFLGRKDTQVKIRGYRIEIGEIEAALLRLPGVREAAALTVASSAGDRSGGILVGCLVLQKKATAEPAPGEDEFRSQLAQHLPSHMIPSRIIVLEELPLSANGKVDRRVLLEKVAPTLVAEDRGVEDEPKDDLERSIWNIWKEILPDRRIGRNDRFYEIGGDSLSVLHMIMRVEKMVGRPIGLRPMQQGGTIVDIAAAARETGPAVPPPMMIGIHSGGSKTPLFFAHGDLATGGLYCQRMAHNLGPDQPLYVVSPHGAAGSSLPSTYEEVGTSFVELIRSAQKKGPYNLGGFCNGALAMFEAAHQLIRAGETVSSLVMLDPPDLSLFLSRRKISRIGKFFGLPEGEGRDTYHRIAEGVEIWQDHGTRRFLRDFWTRGLAWTAKIYRNFFQPPDPRSYSVTLETAYYEAMVRYECQVYHWPTWIILREGESHRHPRQISYWSKCVPAAHYEVVPGTHLELTGNMDEIAAIIQKALAKSQPARV